MEMGKTLVPARALRTDELGAVLAAFGVDGADRARLRALVALLAGNGLARAFAGGGFSETAPNMTDPFTTGLHNCLRGASVNAAQHEAIKIRLGKQC